MQENNLTPIKILKKSLENGRLAHAYLFYGPELKKQHETALWLAQAVNCSETLSKSDPCLKCSSCERIGKGQYPDVIEVFPHGAMRVIRIEEVRKIQETSFYKPFEGKLKVFILHEANCLQVAASNALLKVLEEPTASTVFILLTSEPDSILPTILSRCQGLQFHACTDNFREKMKDACDDDPGLLEMLSEFSQGSIENASALIEKGTWDRRKRFLETFIRAIEGNTLESFNEISKAVALIDAELEEIEERLEEEVKAIEDSDLKKRAQEENKSFLAGERLGLFRNSLRGILAWARVNFASEEHILLLGHLAFQVEEAKRFLERNANFRWVMEALVLKVKSKVEMASQV
jgi:DNA polymerase-3 subunit delta'